MAELPPDGTPLLGVPRRSSAPLNSFALWQYVLIFTAVLIGTLYATQCLSARSCIQVRSWMALDFGNPMRLTRLLARLNAVGGIAIKGADLRLIRWSSA